MGTDSRCRTWTAQICERVLVVGAGCTTLIANGDRTALVKFGYSDRVQVFLNGERLFVGNNAWRSRDYRYLGTITRHVAVPLNLRDGENTLTFAVSETFGGWGVTAALEEADGVRIAR